MMNRLKYVILLVCAVNIDVVKPATIAELVQQGLLIMHCSVGIDFSAVENGKSAHSTCPDKQKAYKRALNSVVTVFQNYDSDKIFSVFGYGATTPASAECPFGHSKVNVADVVNTYTKLAAEVTPASPNLAPIIRHAIKSIKDLGNAGKNYYVLIILTDGQVSDKNAAIEAIIDASELPLSIVAVGVGARDYSVMHLLDADKTPLEINGKKAKRDIVQFVAFDKVNAEGDTAAELLGGLLTELPGQVSAYVESVVGKKN